MLESLAQNRFRVRGMNIAFVSALTLGAAFVFSIWAIGPGRLTVAVCIVAGVLGLLVWPEVALAAYSFAGDVKGNDALSSLVPFDLTLTLGAVLMAGIAVNFLRRRPALMFPKSYLLFVVLTAQMALSLAYTPVFEAGLDKLLRFLTVTAIVIIAPFFVLTTIEALQRFLTAFGILGFAICGLSLLHLGGSERLATPSDNTIGLGHIACWTIILVWFAPLRRETLMQHGLALLLLAAPALALLGSGSRGPAIACVIVIALSVLHSRRKLLNLGIIAAIGFTLLPFAGIPGASKDYLATLIESPNLAALLSFRGDLLNYGWIILKAHPIFGIGLQGFRYGSPNSAVYNWPHNIFLEVACELGLPALAVIVIIFGTAARESWRQLRYLSSSYKAIGKICAALFLTGAINATNTGDINSDRSSWLFISLIFVLSQISEFKPACAQIRGIRPALQPQETHS